VDAGSNNWNEREGIYQRRMDLQERMKKISKFKTLGTERFKNVCA
jgi:hypothetical protein